MQIITNVTDIRILGWVVNITKQRVEVDFQMMTDQGEPYRRAKAFFWAELPTNPVDDYGNPVTDTSLWYQLPPEYIQTLTSITVDARTALLPLIQ